MGTPAPRSLSNRLYDIAKLKDTKGYPAWSLRTKIILGDIDAWSIVSGRDERPPNATDPANAALVSAATATQEKWDARNLKGYQQIALSLEDEPLKAIADIRDAKTAWERLATRYVGTGLQQQILLLMKLWRAQLTADSPMQEQLDELKLTFRRINAFGSPLGDKYLAAAIILALPTAYQVLQTVIATNSFASPIFTSNSMITQVLAEEQRQKGTPEVAYFAKSAPKGKSASVRWGRSRGRNVTTAEAPRTQKISAGRKEVEVRVKLRQVGSPERTKRRERERMMPQQTSQRPIELRTHSMPKLR
jgi:hypothetical protein